MKPGNKKKTQAAPAQGEGIKKGEGGGEEEEVIYELCINTRARRVR